jgi:hypothetical protein
MAQGAAAALRWSAARREAIAAELVGRYRPSCNEQRFGTVVREEWVGRGYGSGSISTPSAPE